MVQTKKLRIEQLNFTRFLAAISIVVFHFGLATKPFDGDGLSMLFSRANVAVSFFFVLSGFVIIISSAGKSSINISDFFKRRFARIYPVYFFALCLTVLLLIQISEVNPTDLFLNLSLFQGWFPGTAMSLNYPGWSLSAEVFFYALFPFLFNKIYCLFSLKKVTVMVVSFWIISQIFFLFSLNVFPAMVKFWHYVPLLHFNEFLIGNLGGILFLKKWSGTSNNMILPILFTLLFVVFDLQFPINYHNGILAPFFVLFIILLARDKSVISTTFRKKVFNFLGEISYSVYILQFPVWLLISDYRLFKYLGIIKGTDLSFYAKLIFLLFFSSFTYYIIEMPLRRLILKMKIVRIFASSNDKISEPEKI